MYWYYAPLEVEAISIYARRTAPTNMRAGTRAAHLLRKGDTLWVVLMNFNNAGEATSLTFFRVESEGQGRKRVDAWVSAIRVYYDR